jgi:hypothetical protein
MARPFAKQMRTRRRSLQPWELPTYFKTRVWTPPFNIYELPTGKFESDYNPDNYKPSISNALTAWVSKTRGNDGTAALGSSSTAYSTCVAARTAGAQRLIIDGGVYNRADSFAALFDTTTNVVLESWDGNPVILTRAYNAPTWSQYLATNTYSFAAPQGVVNVVDLTWGCDGVNTDTRRNVEAGDTPKYVAGSKTQFLPIPYTRINHVQGAVDVASGTLVGQPNLPGLVANDAFTVKSSASSAGATSIVIGAGTTQAQLLAAIDAVYGDALATSTSSVLIGTGTKTFTLSASGLNIRAGELVTVYNTGTPANFIRGYVRSYVGTTLVIVGATTGGAGTLSSWSVAKNLQSELVYITPTDTRIAIRTTDGGDLVLSESVNTPLADLGITAGTIKLGDTVNTAGAGFWGFDGVNVFVRTRAGGSPNNANIIVMSLEGVTAFSSTTAIKWFKNIAFWGHKPFIDALGGSNTAITYLTDCNANYNGAATAGLDDPVSEEGNNFYINAKTTYMLRCDGSFSMSGDGISSFTTQDTGQSPPIFNDIFLQDCSAWYCGHGTGINDNGFTFHNGATAGVDLNGSFEKNIGPNVSVSGQALMLGTRADRAKGIGSGENNFTISGYGNNFASLMYMRNTYCGTGAGGGWNVGTGGQFINLGGNTIGSVSGGTTNLYSAPTPYQQAILELVPDALRGWWELDTLSQRDIVSGGVDDLFDFCYERANLADGGTRPTYDATNALCNGAPAMNFGLTTNAMYMVASKSMAGIKEIVWVGAYKDGVDATFDAANTIMAISGDTKAIRGVSGAATLDATGTINSTVSKNGALASSTILPGEFSIYRHTIGTAQTDTFRFFGSGTAARGWQGPVAALFAFRRDLTAPEFAALLALLRAKFGISA